MKNLIGKAVLCLAGAAFIAGAVSCTNTEAKIEKELQTVMDVNKCVGLAVVVVKDNKVIYEKALGLKDMENNVPLDLDGLFRIASISKQFTATSLMQQIEQGKLTLDTDVSEILGFPIRNPKYPDIPITVRMLLSHSSSMSDANGYYTLNRLNPDSCATADQAWNDWKPGTKYEYCNLGFNTLGAVLERVSGERFDEYVPNHILKPLGIYGGYNVNNLDSTKFVRIYEWQSADSTFKWSPEAYAPRTEEIANYQFGYSTPVFSPTGGMKISPRNLAKIMKMHMNYGKGFLENEDGTETEVRIIDSLSAVQMQTTTIYPSDPGDNGYGFALWQTEQLVDGQYNIGHTGSAYGVFTSMFWNDAHNFGVVVMCNGCNEREDRGYMAIHREVNGIMYKYLNK